MSISITNELGTYIGRHEAGGRYLYDVQPLIPYEYFVNDAPIGTATKASYDS